MLGLGIGEILMVAVVLLVVVGPDRLPQVFRAAGKIYGQVRRAGDEMRRAFTMEADRQDADERFAKLQERRQKAQEAREAALKAAGGHSVAQPDDVTAAAQEVAAPAADEPAETATTPAESPPTEPPPAEAPANE